MTDADRLRQAANRLDEMAVDLEAMHIKVAANPAALLRAVEVGHGVKCWCQGGLIIDARCAAGFSLADIILGDAQ